jgi:hypothetical protein
MTGTTNLVTANSVMTQEVNIKDHSAVTVSNDNLLSNGKRDQMTTPFPQLVARELYLEVR